MQYCHSKLSHWLGASLLAAALAAPSAGVESDLVIGVAKISDFDIPQINNGSNFGFEHPWWQEKLAGIQPLVDDDERWAAQAEMARFIFDNVMTLPLFGEPTIWPLGPDIGPWDLQLLNDTWLTNTEYAPHRQ